MTAAASPITLTFPSTSPGPHPLSIHLKFYIYYAEIAVPLRVILIPVFHTWLPAVAATSSSCRNIWQLSVSQKSFPIAKLESHFPVTRAHFEWSHHTIIVLLLQHLKGKTYRVLKKLLTALASYLHPDRKKYSLLRDKYFCKDSRIRYLHWKSLNMSSEWGNIKECNKYMRAVLNICGCVAS